MKIMKNQQLAKLINKGWRFSFEIGHKKDWPHQCLLNFVEFVCIRNFEQAQYLGQSNKKYKHWNSYLHAISNLTKYSSIIFLFFFCIAFIIDRGTQMTRQKKLGGLFGSEEGAQIYFQPSEIGFIRHPFPSPKLIWQVYPIATTQHKCTHT